MLYKDWYQDVLPMVGDVPLPSLVRAVRDSVIRFCKVTKLYREWLYGVQVNAGSERVDLVLPPDTELDHISSVTFRGREVESGSRRKAQMAGPCNPGEPQMYFMEYGRMILYPTPTADCNGALNVEMVLHPTRGSKEWRCHHAERFFEVIASGAIANLHMIPDQTFTSPDRAMMYAQQFAAGIEEAKAHVDNSRGSKIMFTEYGGY